MPSESCFAIRNSVEIIGKLTLMWKQGCLITAHFGENKESFITAITSVDKARQVFTLDCASKDYLNKNFLSASEVTFNSVVSGIRVQFSHKNITTTSIKGAAAFLLSIPETLYWLEQRKFYRVRSPMSNPALCTVKIKITQDDQEATQELHLKIQDISISGLCLQIEPEELTEDWQITNTLDNCFIELPEIGDFYSTLELRNQRSLTPDREDKTQLIGVQLVNASPAIEAKIQRYMQLVERENRKKS
ncbi:MAG: flagellar brake protein [Methyloprofundus sp.]|nr:flagellar brake protein [Methyloprofundus sp.]MDT8426549.1 flagellar brake protein [Methyloprofundus sp.]